VPVYMSERYQSLLAAQDGSKARVLSIRANNEIAWLPLLVRDVGHCASEAYSAYGYGGLFGKLKLNEEDVDKVRSYLAEAGINSLFVRHCPFTSNQLAWPAHLTQFNRITYATTLRTSSTLNEYLEHVPQKLRWSANFAMRAGLTVNFHSLEDCGKDKISAFYREYSTLMAAKGTSKYYLFSEEFFLEHSRKLGKYCELAELIDSDGEFLAGAFFLMDQSGWAHYHLSAASTKSMKLQGMELLILAAIQRYGQRGLVALHLGGGHNFDESDGLSRFKLKFADRKFEFHCSTMICNVDSYNRERARLPLLNPSFFLLSDARGTYQKSYE